MSELKTLVILFIFWLIIIGALFGWSVYTLSNILYKFYSGEKLVFWDFFWGLCALFIFLNLVFPKLKTNYNEE